MAEWLDEENIRPLLITFMDGELDAAQRQKVLDYLQHHPDAVGVLQQEQAMRAAAQRVVLSVTPKPSSGLRQKILDISHQQDTSLRLQPRPSQALKTSGIPWWGLAGALAASVAVGLIIGLFAKHPVVTSTTVANIQPENPYPVDTVLALTRQHIDCSRFLSLHIGGFPKELGELEQFVKLDNGGAHPYPDMSAVGYQFVGAGPCRPPMGQMAHLLYRSTKPNITDALSIFVLPYGGQPVIEEGKIYSLAEKRFGHPVLLWRSQKVVYFVVGNSSADVARAAGRLAGEKS